MADIADGLICPIDLGRALVSPFWAVPPDGFESRNALGCDGASFLAGAALLRLDALVSGGAGLGVWRERLGLDVAAAAARKLGLFEDCPRIRDQYYFRSAENAASRAGAIFEAWLRAANHPIALSPDELGRALNAFGYEPARKVAAICDGIRSILVAARPPVFAAAEAAALAIAERPEAEVFSWWVGDLVLARSMRWQKVVPLAGAAIGVKRFGSGSAGMGEEVLRDVCLSYVLRIEQAIPRALELHRRAMRLVATAEKSRSEAAVDLTRLLVSHDAVAASIDLQKSSGRGIRRFLARMEEAEVLAELTGRTTSRLYGL